MSIITARLQQAESASASKLPVPILRQTALYRRICILTRAALGNTAAAFEARAAQMETDRVGRTGRETLAPSWEIDLDTGGAKEVSSTGN